MVLEINQIYSEIEKIKKFYPNKKVNFLFGELVKYVVSSERGGRLSKKEIDNLRKRCSEAEFELESYWVKKILSSEDKNKIQEFPYYNNYLDLTCLEWNSLKACKMHSSHKNALFIGGGPLPLTAIILAKDYDVNVSILDLDKEAVDLATKLVEKLELEDKIKIFQKSAQDFEDYDKYEVIFVAALVGSSFKEKKEIFQIIRNKSLSGTHILARSSYGKRKLLYQPINSKSYEGFTPIIEVRPLNEIINSVIVLKRE